MTTVNLSTTASTIAPGVPEPSCSDYLLEKIADVWEAIYVWIAAFFSTPAATPAPAPTFSNLPLPLRGRIVNFNDAKNNALTIALVSPSFYQVYKKWLSVVTPDMHAQGSHAFFKFYEKAFSHQETPVLPQKLLKTLNLAPLSLERFREKITKLDIRGDNLFFHHTTDWQLFASPHPALQELTLRFIDSSFTSENHKQFVQNVVKNCPEIRRLEMYNVHDQEMSELITGLQKLQTVDISTDDPVLPPTQAALSKHPKLKSVEFSYWSGHAVLEIEKIPHVDSLRLLNTHTRAGLTAVDDLAVCYLHQKAKVPLESLELIHCYQIKDVDDLFNFPRLRSLNIHECPNIGATAFRGAQLPELRELSLYSSSLKGLLEPISTFPKLEKLSLHSCRDDTREELAPLGRCIGLKEFTWSTWVSWLRFVHLSLPLENCTLLERVKLSKVQMAKGYGTEDLVAFTQKLPHLKELDLSESNGQIDKETVKSAAESRRIPFQYRLPAKEKP